MMNQLQRHANIRAVSCMAESSPEAVAEIGRLQTDVDFIAKTKYASENPNSKEAKEVRLKLQNVIQTTGKNVPYSPSERAEATTTLLTMSQIFGPPNIFMTMSMDDAHTALTLRMSFPSSKQAANLLFPATDSGFSEALFEGQDMFTDSIPITDAKLFERMNQNPVAAAEYFRIVVDAIYDNLLGIRQDKHLRRSVLLGLRQKGIFGVLKAFYHVAETQAGHGLHIHGVGMSNLTSVLQQDAAAFPELVKIIAEVIDSMLIGELPALAHASRFDRLITAPAQREALKPRRGVLGQPVVPIFQSKGDLEPISVVDIIATTRRIFGEGAVSLQIFTENDTVHAFNERVKDVMLLTICHRHTFICHKGSKICPRCRLALKHAT